LHEFDVFESKSEAKKNVVEIVKSVAARLGNTPSVCRKCYIHPLVIEAYLSGAFTKTIREQHSEESPAGLQWEESVLMNLMQRVLKLAAA
jgi:DNA topoisomerase I